MNLSQKKYDIFRLAKRPSIIKDIIQAKIYSQKDFKEIVDFISRVEESSPAHLANPDDRLNLNRLCNIEDWENNEMRRAFSELPHVSSAGIKHRKNWEWSLGAIAMNRTGKLNEKTTAIGIGSGKELILFYLANRLKHVYATDLYDDKGWRETPGDFPEDPKKYAPFAYREDGLTISRMDATNLEFPAEMFDVAFSFSSIEHFGGENHSGALQSLNEIERVLKPGGIAIIATEYVINNKQHPEFFNASTIYTDLINKLHNLRLVQPLDLRITYRTLNAIIDKYSSDRWWSSDYDYKKNHPYIVMKFRNVIWTSVMLVLEKMR